MKNDNPTPHGQAFPPLRSEDSPASTPPQADLLEEMQLLWDRQSQRLDQLLDEHPEGLTRGLGRGYPLSRRRRLMGPNLLILLLGLVCGSLGLVRFLAEPTLFYHLLAYLMGGIGVYLSVCPLLRWLHFLRHPAWVPAPRLPLQGRHAEPLYHHPPRAAGLQPPDAQGSTTRGLLFVLPTIPQAAVLSVMLLLALVVASCAPQGDGYAMTQVSPTDRQASITTITTITTLLTSQ